MAEAGELIKILLVEDNPDDILITQKALNAAKVINQLYVTRDGQEALDFLQRQGRYQDPQTSPRPGLILLDLNMPKVNGLEVLAYLKRTDSLKSIPVVVLTSSKRDEDIVRSYENGCNSYLQKPVEFEKFVELVKQVGLYWALLNVEPPASG